jgi:hypothetical protein
MLAVVLDVKEGGKDFDPRLDAKGARGNVGTRLQPSDVDVLRRYDEACVTNSDHRVKTTLERDRRRTLKSEREHFMSMYLGAAR